MTGPQPPGHVDYLDLDDVVDAARSLFGDPPPIRDVGLLGSAVARPQTTLFGEDAYLDMWSKAAALLQSIVANHALLDGNKRLGWVATATFLEINGITIENAANDDVYDLVIDVSTTHHEIDDLAGRLRTVVLGDPLSSGDGARADLHRDGGGGDRRSDRRHRRSRAHPDHRRPIA